MRVGAGAPIGRSRLPWYTIAMNTADFDAAARLLLDIAGPAPAHIEMSHTGPKKYYSVARALTLADARAHLQGRKTKGALCSRPDDRARALAYDADKPAGWQVLQGAARMLAAAGYRPLLEPSPRRRGGHLWLVFSALVDTQAARSHAHSIAPELDDIGEYWPGPAGVTGWNRIRLPGGRYVAPHFSAWCRLYDADGRELAHSGASAARALLHMQTPAELVSSDHPRERDASSIVTPTAPGVKHDAAATVTPPGAEKPPAKRNTSLLRNEVAPVGRNRFLWFQYSPAQLAEWFNIRHTLEELHPTERGRGGMAFSPSVSEHSPSTSYYDTQDGERWTDFSSRVRRADGRQDGGDALELYVRLRGGSKAALLAELGREMIREARSELETAARRGTQPPDWVVEITTPAGWEHYRKMAQAQGG